MMRVVLVDDEEIILKELKTILEGNSKVEVVGAYLNPLEALEKMKETMPDCAFIDIEMPLLDGIELAERLSAINPGMEIIFVTAYNHYATQAFDVNAVDYILKPIRPERLEKAVDRLLQKVESKPDAKYSDCTIRCFGSFEILVGNQAVKWSRSKSKEFMAYMLQNQGKWITKYKLCEELWPEQDPELSITYLQIAVSGVRKNLKEAGCTQIAIEYGDNRYITRVIHADWDLPQFEEAYERYCRTGEAEAAMKALSVYRDEYLEGEDWLWSDLHRESYSYKYDRLCGNAE